MIEKHSLQEKFCSILRLILLGNPARYSGVKNATERRNLRPICIIFGATFALLTKPIDEDIDSQFIDDYKEELRLIQGLKQRKNGVLEEQYIIREKSLLVKIQGQK